MSDDVKDIDLLDLFGEAEDGECISPEEIPNPNEIKKEAVSKEKFNPADLSNLLDMIGNSGNYGSGDITEDLMNWFNGNDKLPSDPLAGFLSNAVLKAEFGMFFNMIKNFSRMKKLQDFVDKAEDIYFNPEDIMRLDPDELKKRLESASDVMKNLYEMNRRTISGIKQKGKEEEMDKLKILLSAIPSNKLKDIISSLNKNG